MCLENWDRDWRGRLNQMKSQEFASSYLQRWHTTMLEAGDEGQNCPLLLTKVLTNGCKRLTQHISFTHGWASTQWLSHLGVLVNGFRKWSLELRSVSTSYFLQKPESWGQLVWGQLDQQKGWVPPPSQGWKPGACTKHRHQQNAAHSKATDGWGSSF